MPTGYENSARAPVAGATPSSLHGEGRASWGNTATQWQEAEFQSRGSVLCTWEGPSSLYTRGRRGEVGACVVRFLPFSIRQADVGRRVRTCCRHLLNNIPEGRALNEARGARASLPLGQTEAPGLSQGPGDTCPGFQAMLMQTHCRVSGIPSSRW